MYFQVKNTLKNNIYHNLKHKLNHFELIYSYEQSTL
jgi:hypothetical protein